jgi:hypothetical protein
MSTLPKLAAIYRAHGMPYLVVIDKNGKTLTKEGVNSLSHDPVGKNFPWRPNRVVDLLPPMYEIGGTALPMDDLDDKYLLLYFSSYSDAPSKEFKPWLVKAYNILKKKRKDFEVRMDVTEHEQRRFCHPTRCLKSFVLQCFHATCITAASLC